MFVNIVFLLDFLVGAMCGQNDSSESRDSITTRKRTYYRTNMRHEATNKETKARPVEDIPVEHNIVVLTQELLRVCKSILETKLNIAVQNVPQMSNAFEGTELFFIFSVPVQGFCWEFKTRHRVEMSLFEVLKKLATNPLYQHNPSDSDGFVEYHIKNQGGWSYINMPDQAVYIGNMKVKLIITIGEFKSQTQKNLSDD